MGLATGETAGIQGKLAELHHRNVASLYGPSPE